MNVNFNIDITVIDDKKVHATIKGMELSDIDTELANALTTSAFRVVNNTKKIFQQHLDRFYYDNKQESSEIPDNNEDVVIPQDPGPVEETDSDITHTE